MRLQLALILFAHTPLVFGAFQVTDPHDQLKELGFFYKGPAFEQAFSCANPFGPVAFESTARECRIGSNNMIQCTYPGGLGTQGSFRFQLGTGECTKDSVSIFSDDAVPLKVTVTRQDYERGANSWLIPLLTSAGYFVQPDGVAEIQSFSPYFADYIENGKKRNLQLFLILGAFKFPGANMDIGFEIWLSPEFLGPKQIVYFGFSVSEIFLKARGLITSGPAG